VCQTRINVCRDDIRITINVLQADGALLRSGDCATLALPDDREVVLITRHDAECHVSRLAPALDGA
jgi:hypothetical protein